MFYTLNQTTGRIVAIGLSAMYGDPADGNEPFTIYNCHDYRKDFETGEWFFDPIIPVPQSITRYQGMLYLYRIGRLAELKQKVTTLNGEGQVAFENSINWERYNPFVLGMASLLMFTEEDLDNFFIEAVKI